MSRAPFLINIIRVVSPTTTTWHIIPLQYHNFLNVPFTILSTSNISQLWCLPPLISDIFDIPLLHYHETSNIPIYNYIRSSISRACNLNFQYATSDIETLISFPTFVYSCYLFKYHLSNVTNIVTFQSISNWFIRYFSSGALMWENPHEFTFWNLIFESGESMIFKIIIILIHCNLILS